MSRFRLRTLGVTAAAVASLALAGAAAAATVVVSPGHMDGWGVNNDTCGAATTGSVAFVNGPATPPAGTGSVQFTVGTNGDSYPTVRQSDYNGVKLSALTASSPAKGSRPPGQAIRPPLSVETTAIESVSQKT